MSVPYLRLFTGDYIRDTRHLTPMRHGVYLLLLMHCWDQQGPVPLDEQEAAGIANCRSVKERAALQYILDRYFVRRDDGWHNSRISREIEKFHELSAKRSVAGLARHGLSASAERYNKSNTCDNVTPAHAEHMLNTCSAKFSKRSAISASAPASASARTKARSKPSDTDVSLVASDKTADDIEPARPDRKSEQVSAKPSDGIGDCPHQEIIALYRECLPGLTVPRVWSAPRAEALKARWRDCARANGVSTDGYSTRQAGLDYWRAYFEYVASTTLPGGFERNGHRWMPDLPWLIKAENFVKVIEGKYAR